MQREAVQDLAAYYAARATEYDDIYLKPERQDDIASLRAILCDLLKGQSVLEVACGTGFWTDEIAATARHVYATDVNESVLKIASGRLGRHHNVSLQREDAFAPSGENGNCSTGCLTASRILCSLD